MPGFARLRRLAVSGAGWQRWQQVFEVELVKLQIQHPLRLLFKGDARLPLQATVVCLQVEIIQLQLFLFLTPHGLQRSLTGDPTGG